MTHLEAVEYGWWYAARLPNDTLLVMLTTDAETFKVMNLNHSATWFNLLEKTANTRKWIAGARMIDEHPECCPAPSFRLDQLRGRHWLAIGDAASAYDPITSQGIIKSLIDGISAAATIAQYLQHGDDSLDIFEQNVIARYQQYLEMRRYFYRLEKRWPGSEFWRKQQA